MVLFESKDGYKVAAIEFGVYQCNGSNDYGYGVGAVQLIGEYNI